MGVSGCLWVRESFALGIDVSVWSLWERQRGASSGSHSPWGEQLVVSSGGSSGDVVGRGYRAGLSQGQGSCKGGHQAELYSVERTLNASLSRCAL